MKIGKSRALVVCPGVKTFVSRDIQMLQKIFSIVDVRESDASGFFPVVLSLIFSFFWSIINIRKYQLVCSWFVGYNNFFPFLIARLYGIRTVAFLGGTECQNFPEFSSGNYRKSVYGAFTRASLRLSDVILPVHESLIETEITYTPVIYKKQGLKAFNKNLTGKIAALHCGFEEHTFLPDEIRIPNSFLSAAGKLYGGVYERKGVDLFVSLAEALPMYKFTLVGDGYIGPRLDNLEIIKSLPYDKLVNLYRTHEFYIQFSIAEGFPNALAEAMLYGCIPLGSNVFGIPDIIGDTGYILQNKNTQEALELIKTAATLDTAFKKSKSEAAHIKIKDQYTFENRLAKFKEIMNL